MDYYPLSDLLYRTVALTDDPDEGDVAVVEAYDTDAYGNTLIFDDPGPDEAWFTDDDATTDEPTCRFIFTGREFDPETEIYYYRARYYQQELGRFLSRDPALYSTGIGLHEFVQSRPGRHTDPMGLQAFPPGYQPPEIGPFPFVKEGSAAYRAFREAGENPLGAARDVILAGAIAWGAFDYGEAAKEEAKRQCKGPREAEGIANALRHALVSAALTRAFGKNIAKKIMDSHEVGSEDPVDTKIDEFNNEVGYDIGENAGSLDEIKQNVEGALEQGDLITDTQDPRVGL